MEEGVVSDWTDEEVDGHGQTVCSEFEWTWPFLVASEEETSACSFASGYSDHSCLFTFLVYIANLCARKVKKRPYPLS